MKPPTQQDDKLREKVMLLLEDYQEANHTQALLKEGELDIPGQILALIHDREAKAERRAEERLHPLNLFKGVKGVTHYQIRLYGDDKWLLDTLLYDVHTQLTAQSKQEGSEK